MDMKQICKNQVKEAQTHRWHKGERIGRDPGDDAIKEWIQLYAKDYRDKYNQTYESTLLKVKQEARTDIDKIVGDSLTIKQKSELVNVICDKFTEIWVKEVAIDERNNPHLEEI